MDTKLPIPLAVLVGVQMPDVDDVLVLPYARQG